MNKSETPKKVSKRLKGHYLRTYEPNAQAVHKRLFDSAKGQNDPADGKNLSQNNKKTKNLAKKYYIRLRKFKNIESPKMVSIRLDGQYLRSYEQLSRPSDFNCDFEAKPEPINWIYQGIFEYTKTKEKLIKKWDNSQRQFKKSETPKNGVKTAQRPLFKEL